jgi:NAD(P)-dependent dehydrogenase (short-subunit alcohol dehydrogenase family)
MSVLDRFRLDGKKALVTGAGAGLGRAMAIALAEAGADLAVVDINGEAARSVAHQIQEMGRRSLPIQADVTQALQVSRMVEETIGALGRLDIAVNNTGMAGGGIPVEEMTEEWWRKVMDTNVHSMFLCAQAEAKVMIPQRRGKIVNIASMCSFIVNKGFPATLYCASKGAVLQMTRGLAAEWVKHNITVNAIAPGYFKTDLTRRLWEDPEKYQKCMLDLIPMGRLGEPDELAGAIVYLASDACSYMTGQALVIDGGYTIW